MALEIPIGFAQITFVMQQAGDPDPYNCTIGVDPRLTTASNEDVLLQAREAWAGWILAGQSDELTLTSVRGTFGTDGVDPILIEVPGGLQGGSTAQMLPSNCALLVRKNTLLGGRRNRGRMFIPAIVPEGQVDQNGIIQPVVVDGLQAQIDSFLEDMAGIVGVYENDLKPVILHNEKLGAPLEPTPISSMTVQNKIATQRRRLR